MVRRDYQSKNLKNPFFKPVRNKKIWRRFLFIFIFLLLLITIIFSLFFSPLFIIKKIEIRGAERTNVVELEAWLWQAINQPRIFNLPPANLFLFPSHSILSPVMQEFDLTSFNVKKFYPQTLIINLAERQPVFISQFNEDFQLRDQSACPINNAPVTEGAYLQYPLIKFDNLTIDSWSNCLSLTTGYLDDILEIFVLSKDYSEFLPQHFLVNGDNQTVNMIIDSGPTVYLNRREDIDNQLIKLAVVCQEKTLNELSVIEYIDVRYGDKAYIK